MKVNALLLCGALVLGTVPALHAQTGFSDKDKSYLKDVAEGNLAEVKMGQLALKTSKNEDIRTFAQKMITDHTALYNGEKPVAMKAGVKLPTSPSTMQSASYLKLKALSGETFDKSYVKGMVSDHQDDLEATHAENAETQNADMKKLTAHAADVMTKHKAMIDGIAGKMGLQ